MFDVSDEEHENVRYCNQTKQFIASFHDKHFFATTFAGAVKQREQYEQHIDSLNESKRDCVEVVRLNSDVKFTQPQSTEQFFLNKTNQHLYELDDNGNLQRIDPGMWVWVEKPHADAVHKSIMISHMLEQEYKKDLDEQLKIINNFKLSIKRYSKGQNAI